MVVHDGPAVVRPGDWSQVCFAAEMMKISAVGTKSQKDNPPTAIVRFNQVGMPCPLNRMKPTVAMSENGIVWAWFERTPGADAAGYRDHMPVFCPPFGDHQIIAVVEIVQMWSFRETTTGPSPDTACIRSSLPRLKVNFTQIDARRMAIGRYIDTAIRIE